MCEHSHDHEHHHDHDHVSPEERLALLTYLLGHNRHHAEELHELAHGLDGEASELIHEAVSCIEESNRKIEAALKLLEA